jgi:hypothetical protein
MFVSHTQVVKYELCVFIPGSLKKYKIPLFASLLSNADAKYFYFRHR